MVREHAICPVWWFAFGHAVKMSSAKAGTDPFTLAIATAVDTVAAAPTAGETTPATPQIHVHHFHHQSCLHHPEVLCTTLPTGVPVVSRSEDDYAVVLNSTNATCSPLRPTLQPVNNKLSTVIFTAPRKTVCTATIRHPSLASLVFHQPRNTHSLDPASPSNSSFFNNATGASPTFVSQTSSPHFFPRDQPGASVGGSSINGAHATPTSLYAQTITGQSVSQTNTPSRVVPVSFVPERAATLSPGDPSIYYRLATAGYNLQTTTNDQQRGCPNIPDPTPCINLTDRLLRWFRAGETTSVGRDTNADNMQAQRRRSKSQPPQHQRRVQLVQIDPRCVQTALEVTSNNATKRNEPTQHQRPKALVSPPNGAYQAPSSRRRQLPPAPCTCSHHHQPQLHQTPQQVSLASPLDHQHRSRLPRWLFPCGPHQKHSLSPPPTCPPCVVPPPPPPRSTAIKLKPSTRSVEVQTQPEAIPACCCASTGIEPAICGLDGLSGCCSGEHKQHIMLHHYHFHHYYHCEAQEPANTPAAANATTSTAVAVAVAEPVDSRPSSPLIKLSVTWPPNAAISVEEHGEEEGENGSAVLHLLTTEERHADETCATIEQTADGDPPAPVSDALRAIESAKVETPTGQPTRPSFKVEEVETRNEEPPTRILLNTQASVIDVNQTDQRRFFLQNINQLKRTGWYWGPLTIEEAELLLKDRPNGSFLVRDSGHELYILSVSFRAENRTYHTRIEHTGGKFGFAVQGDADTTSPSIAQFINHVIAESERGRTRFFLRQSALTTSANQQGGGATDQSEDENHHVEARLLYPVSRFLVVHSLAHLCRFEILLKVRKDHIDLLPLPERLKKYLHERQYYTEFVQAYLESAGHLLPNNLITTEATNASTSEVAMEEDEIEDHV
ncbi:Suppressor of cytokine signaling 7 [Taenia crassiceps]|uniref:Suppressor of cytokine signaling 7 n=1 Tax=Taenia crassiceps TaxID=6207 RepID=A0ABR4QLT2_9CEST